MRLAPSSLGAVLLTYLKRCIREKNSAAVYWLSDVLEGLGSYVSDGKAFSIKLGEVVCEFLDVNKLVGANEKKTLGLPHLLRAWLHVCGKFASVRSSDRIQKAIKEGIKIVFWHVEENPDRGVVDCAVACNANSKVVSLVVTSDEISNNILRLCLL